MDFPRLERKQATVLNGDVAGFSRMMADNDLRTVEFLLTALDRIAGLVGAFGGRLVDATGDNFMAEFPSELAALRCAIEVHRSMLEQQRERAESERLQYRIGVHSGSLLGYGSRLYGDVVNLAARLQSSAQPGQIMLSEAVAQRAGSLKKSLLDRGLQHFKNIPYALHVFETRRQATA